MDLNFTLPGPFICKCSFKEASYNGGGNITFRGTLKDDSYSLTRLFEADFVLGTLPITFTFSVRPFLFLQLFYAAEK